MAPQEKVALVTGGCSGIGQAAALAFADARYAVVIADISGESADETVEPIRARGGEAFFVEADVSKPHDVAGLIEAAISTYGRIDCAFNNAGIEGAMAATADCTEHNWERTLAINLTGVWLCMKHEIPHMLERGRGAIVNCASVAGLVGFANLPAYTASKHGVVGLTRAAALEYAKRGIRVNAVCPGVIQTPMVDRVVHDQPEMEQSLIAGEPIGRLGRPAEVAAAV
ncbi:MAG TPA: SDR family NAD(P)-dependent oxidoreductase, partial [Woeseiaceae bacterium]|nr:SDR family NAD(P)-dependent oxidoreductase [Woeseiaceae bacterium]